MYVEALRRAGQEEDDEHNNLELPRPRPIISAIPFGRGSQHEQLAFYPQRGSEEFGGGELMLMACQMPIAQPPAPASGSADDRPGRIYMRHYQARDT